VTKITVHESWTKYADGRVTVRKVLDCDNGRRIDLGEVDTPYIDIPFIIVDMFEELEDNKL